MAADTRKTSKKKKARTGSATGTKSARSSRSPATAGKTTKASTAKKPVKKPAKTAAKKTSVRFAEPGKRSPKTAAKKTRQAAATPPIVEMLDRMPTDDFAAVETNVAVTAPETVSETTSDEAFRPVPDEAAVAVLEIETALEAPGDDETRGEFAEDDPVVFASVDDSIDRIESPAGRRPDAIDVDMLAPTDSEVLGDELQLVCFTLDDEEYGVDIQQVQEINRISRVTAMPDAPAYVKGIINLRGNVIPVVDLRLRLGYLPKDDDKHTRIVVLDFDGRLIGLIVDAVTEVLRVSRALIERTPDLAATAGRECLAGIFQQDTKMILSIDPRKILQF